MDFDLLGGLEFLVGNDTSLKNDLEEYWPEVSRNKDNGDFYAHEWNKHGTCYLLHMINENKEVYEKDPIAFSQ